MIDIKKALYTAILIGIGNIFYMTIKNSYVSAMLFSLALLTVINSNLNLYTGKIGFYKKYSFGFLLKALLANLAGSIFICMIFLVIQPQIAKEFDIPLMPMYLIFNPFRCLLEVYYAVCIHIAVSNKNTIITIFSIMIFILCGFRHCIADFPFLVLNFSFINLIKFIAIIFGNSIGAVTISFLSCE